VKPDWAKKGDDDGDAALSKKANSILNKLTLEKFDRLSTEFCALEFSTMERVAGAVDLIVTKAQTESHFVSVYASLCVKLANTPNEALGEDEGSTKKFRRLLLERCQAEFERDHSQTIAELESLDEESRERKLAKIRKQYIGHMFFIGALYKQGLLKENIMHHCVQELFGDPSEPDSEKLECLAKLLTSIGKKLDAAALDKKESAKFMKAYFKQLKKLENNKSLDARLRFALKDLRELRENTWVPRRKVEEAKTIQEIHDDIQAEEDKKAGRKPTRVKRDRSANNLTIISDDGWETVPTTTASVRRSSSKKERSQSPATVPSDVSMGGFGALLGGDKKKRDKDKKKKKKSRSKDSLTDLEEVSSTPFDEDKYRGKCKAAVAEYFSIEVVDEVVACARE
jgi:translation initiation factor 4G